MQNSMVMLKDLIESRKLDSVIKEGTRPFASFASGDDEPRELYLKAISRLYWPQDMISNETFQLPDAIERQIRRMDIGFEALKKSRKLHWLLDQGFVVIELEMSDRFLTFKHVPTYAATVIDAFSSHPPSAPSASVIVKYLNGGEVGNAWSISQLKEALSMSSELISKSINFWVDKRVLAQMPSDPDVYYVMETLPQSDIPASQRTTPHNTPRKSMSTATIHAAQQQVRKRALSFISTSTTRDLEDEDGTIRDNQTSPIKPDASGNAGSSGKPEPIPQHFMLAWNFIQSMLTNQGALTTDRIFGTLSMFMIPVGGPGFDASELDGFLMRMEDEGKVEKTTEGWKMRIAK